jgi:putative tryptophan/tyrosine transport system substrate-binding protein
MPDLLFGCNSNCGIYASTVPIVQMIGDGDLVAEGLAVSVARPGGNVTGMNHLSRQLDGKRLQLLKDAVPAISRVAVIWDASFGPFGHEELKAAARMVGVQLLPLEVHTPEAIESAFESATGGDADALLVMASPVSLARGERMVELAARARLPAIYAGRLFIDAGGLMIYQPNFSASGRRTGYYVDRILKGAKPADLPIEQPMTFDFVVNLKTAQALGLTFPNEIMLQVTAVLL